MLKVVNVVGADGKSLGQISNNDDFYEPHIDYLCPQCGKEFTEKKYWRAHVSQAHGLNHIAFLAHSRFKNYLQNLPYKFYTRCRKCQKCYAHRKQLVSHLVTVHRILEMPHPNPQPKHQPHPSKQTVTVANETFEITFLDDEPKSIQSSSRSRNIKAKALNDRSYSPPPPPPNSPTSHCYKCKECNSLHNSLVALKMHIRRRHFVNGKYTTSKYITSESANSKPREGNLVRKIDRKEDSRESTMPMKKPLNVESTNENTTVGTASGSLPAKKVITATDRNVVLTKTHKGNLVSKIDRKEDSRESKIPAKKLLNGESTNGNTTVGTASGSCSSTKALRATDRNVVLMKAHNKDRSLEETIHPAKKPKHDESLIQKTVTKTLQRKKDHSLTELIKPTKNVGITKGVIKEQKKVLTEESTKDPAKELGNDLSKTVPSSTESSTSTSLPANNIQDNFQYICPACGLTYMKELHWRRHINEVHQFNKFPYLKMRIRDKNLYQCLMCRGSLLASHLKPLQEHHFRHLPHRLYIKCSVCDTSYNYKPNLLTHSVQCPIIAKKRSLNKPLPPSS